MAIAEIIRRGMFMDKKNNAWVGDTISQALNEMNAPSENASATSESLNQQPVNNAEPVNVPVAPIADTTAEINTGSADVAENAAENTEKAEKVVQQPASDSGNKKNKKKSAKGKVITVLVLMLVIVVGAVWAGYANFALIGDISGVYKIYSRSVSEVDLSGSDITDFSGLGRLDKAKTIDLTNTSVDDLSVLYDCESLETVIMYDKVLPAKQCVEFYDFFPNATLICSIDVNGEVYNSRVEQATVSGSDLSDSSVRLFAALKNLKNLDVSKCEVSDNTYDYLKNKLTECDILRNVDFNGSEYRNDVTTVTMTSKTSEDEVERLKYFPSLELVDARECDNTELVDKVAELYPDVDINRSMTFLGVKVGTADELIDLRGNKYTLDEVKTALDENLKNFTRLKKIDMCGCGLTNTEMEELTNTYPDIKFVWIVKFHRWKVRTDAVVFSALNSNNEEIYDEKDYAPLLKYCTDLIALDLGHSLIKDISSVANMKNLRAIILTDNKITDISAFAELKDLEFIEMNINRVKTVEPLKDLTNLKYVNLWSSKSATDLSYLYNHENLLITIFHRTVSTEERQRFRESNPNCDAYFVVDSEKITTNKAWRSNPYRIDLKKAFSNWKKVVGWSEETGYIFDENTDQYSIT